MLTDLKFALKPVFGRASDHWFWQILQSKGDHTNHLINVLDQVLVYVKFFFQLSRIKWCILKMKHHVDPYFTISDKLISLPLRSKHCIDYEPYQSSMSQKTLHRVTLRRQIFLLKSYFHNNHRNTTFDLEPLWWGTDWWDAHIVKDADGRRSFYTIDAASN